MKKAKKVIGSKSFAYRSNDIWNNLPEKLVNAPSLNSFKNGLDKHWEKEEMKYNFRKLYNKFRDGTRQQDFEFDDE